MPRRNHDQRIRIEKMSYGGQGIGYIEGKVCFVDATIPGETVDVRIIEEKRDYTVGKIVAIIEPSPYRITPRCGIYGLCGGCHFQHIDLHHQITLKKLIFVETCRRLGGFEPKVTDFTPSSFWFYRNKAQLPVQDDQSLKMGYYERRSHKVVGHELCFINNEAINRSLPLIRNRIKAASVTIYNERIKAGNLRHVVIKSSMATKNIHITFVTNERNIQKELYAGLDKELDGLVGICQNLNPAKTNRILGEENQVLWGKPYYEERIKDKNFRIGISSFFQTNSLITEAIGQRIIDILDLRGDENIVDLYAGIGTFGILLAEKTAKCVALEENPEAIRWGIENLQLNHIKNMEFIQGRVEENLSKIIQADCVIMDPPRTGVMHQVIDGLDKLRVQRIIYLSCNPATLARDIKRLAQIGFSLRKTVLFDMFPQTFHIEALVYLEKS